MEKILDELKIKIIETLELLDINPEDIAEDAPLVGGDLGLDSIDILELVVMIERDYSVVIENKEVGEKVFVSLKSLADYIVENSPELNN